MHDIAVSFPADPLDYHRAIRPAGWIVYEQTPTSLELRDPDITMFGAACSGWLLILISLTMLSMAVGLFAIFAVVERALFALALGALCLANSIFFLYCIWKRWSNPSLMRIGGGRFFLQRRHGGKSDELERDVHDITRVESAHGSTTFHSHYSIRVHFRDGSKVPFLHCRNAYEGSWVVKLIEETVALEKESGFLVNTDQALQPVDMTLTTLPAPPLIEALRERVGAIDEQVIKIAAAGERYSEDESVPSPNQT